MARSKLTIKFRNRLLAALTPSDLALLEPNFTAVTFERHQCLEFPNKKIDALYFVEHGIASVVGICGPNAQSEVGLIGCEGVTGLAAILGANRSPHSTNIQIGGRGQRISATAFLNIMSNSTTLHTILMRYAQTFLVQTAHTAVANAKASIEERLARWILMAHDRVNGDDVNLTHELLAFMLGTRRPGVTDALRALVKYGLIRTERRHIVILDRKGLEERAGRFYGVPEAEYDRLIG